jgi:hypothetical protein
MDTSTSRYRAARNIMVGTILGCALTLTSTIVGTQHADASQPYGGCDEAWQAPQSEGADWCRDHGWTVHKRFVLNRNDVPVALRVNPCQTEDSDGWCYWNAEEQGDGEGNSFIIRGERDGKHRIWWVNFR